MKQMKRLSGAYYRKDREAGELLVERHYKRIYKEIYLKTSDEELAKTLRRKHLYRY